MEKGRFTLPGETGMESVMGRLVEEWGVDAVRDSDGTSLSKEIQGMDLAVYTTLCLIRMDNAWVKQHPKYRQQIYLITQPDIAVTNQLEIELMAEFFDQQFSPNEDVDIKRYWQVIDRTTAQPVAPEDWEYDAREGCVRIKSTKAFHSYTVSFLAYQIWEPVSMYNHLTNGWQEEHKIPVDIRYEEVQRHLLDKLEEWLRNHPETDVVRFTTFFYNFDLIYDETGKEKQVNWFGYARCVSKQAIEDFEKVYGYELYPEDFVDAGKYHTPFENPDKRYLDWMEFNQHFIAEYARMCVSLVHKYGKKAIMFLGDHWTGTEPYGKYFETIGLDAVVGAAGDGVTTRMIADINIKETEARFYPYFFPDVFHEGGNPVAESIPIWRKCRRAMLQKPVARMGYGGYLSLAVKFPDFISHVTEIAEQFRSIHEESLEMSAHKASFKVAVLNGWGHIRSWMTHQVAHSLWNQRCYSYLGVMEALAGLPFDVEFISFSDIKHGGISKDVGVLINAGDGGTSFSGAEWWQEEEIVTCIRKWVYDGGGFIGVGEPSACMHSGKYFQLEDVLGVQKEMGFTASTNKPVLEKNNSHFITEDITGSIDYGEGMPMIYQAEKDTQVLDITDGSLSLAVHDFGKGHAVYMAGAPYNADNTRILLRSVYWCAGKAEELYRWFSENPQTECHGYPKAHKCCIVNNSMERQETMVYLGDGNMHREILVPMEMKWVKG